MGLTMGLEQAKFNIAEDGAGLAPEGLGSRFLLLARGGIERIFIMLVHLCY